MKGSIKLFLLSVVALAALSVDAGVVKGHDHRRLAENGKDDTGVVAEAATTDNGKNAAAADDESTGNNNKDNSEAAAAVDTDTNKNAGGDEPTENANKDNSEAAAADVTTENAAAESSESYSDAVEEVTITEEMMQYAVPISEDAYMTGGSYSGYDSEKKNDGYKSSGDFADNTMGYCVLDKLSEIQELERLMSTHVMNVNLFLSDGSAISALKDWVSLVKDYLPYELKSHFTDQQILSVIMIQGVTGPTKTLTTACSTAIMTAYTSSLTVFNKLMGVGAAFNPNAGDAHMVTNTLTVLLNIINLNTDTFTKFRDLVLTSYDVFTVPLSNTTMSHKYFNQDWLKATASWQELALSPVSIVAKFAAVELAQAVQIQSAFNSGSDAKTLQALYDNALAVCNAPTEAPSAAPSLGPQNQNINLAVIAVTDFVMDDVQAIELLDSWTTFRSLYPQRFFCLLQLRGFESERLKIPAVFFNDTMATIKKVNRDDGDSFRQSDYFDLCNLNAIAAKGVEIIPLFVDIAGGNVDASRALLVTNAAARQMRVITAPKQSDTNWITPFIRDFAIT